MRLPAKCYLNFVFIVTQSWDSSIKLWRLDNTYLGLESTGLATISDHTAEIRCLAIDPRGGLLASGSSDGQIYIHDLANNCRVLIALHMHCLCHNMNLI